MKMRFQAVILLAIGATLPVAMAQSIPETYEKVRDSVVLIETKARELAPRTPGKLVPGEKITITVLRGGKRLELEAIPTPAS